MDRPHLWGNDHPTACVFCVAAVYGEKGQVALPQNDAAFADPMGSWRTSVAGQCVADNDNFLDFSLCFDVAVYMIIRKSQKTVPLEDWDGLVRESENTSDYTELVDLFTKLPPSYRSVLEMKILHGFSDKEVAAHLGISETAVSSRASRGRSLLREIVKKEGFCI